MKWNLYLSESDVRLLSNSEFSSAGKPIQLVFELMHSQSPGKVNDKEIVSLRKYIGFAVIAIVKSVFREDESREMGR